jgi:hypothetical protein
MALGIVKKIKDVFGILLDILEDYKNKKDKK